MKPPEIDLALYSFLAKRARGYTAIAKWLAESMDFEYVVDVGCGTGHLVSALNKIGKTAYGIDIALYKHSPVWDYVHKEAMKKVANADIFDIGVQKSDLVVCMEVAEHIPSGKGKLLCEILAKSALRWLFFTAAPPGQGGSGHVNERPQRYWICLLEQFGLKHDLPLTIAARRTLALSASRLWWISQNALVFRGPLTQVSFVHSRTL